MIIFFFLSNVLNISQQSKIVSIVDIIPPLLLLPLVFPTKLLAIYLLDSATLLETFFDISKVVDTLVELLTIFLLEAFNMSVTSSTSIFIFSKLLLVFSNILSLFFTKRGI